LDKEIPENYIFHKEMRIQKRIAHSVVKILNGIRIMCAGLVDHSIEEK
jgi:hypothetical protein